MSRTIDSLPRPKNPKDKVIVLSYGRNGTLGLYKAFQILGYNPYHLVTCFTQGERDVRIIREGMEARMDGTGKPYGREEFDRWFPDNAAILDVCAFFPEELVSAYPDAKFILTHRDPQAWLRSVNNTFVPLGDAMRRFPMRQMALIDPFTRQFKRLSQMFERYMWGQVRKAGERRDNEAVRAYEEHNALVRRIVPPDQLLVVKLEDGLGWEQICPFLGEDIPDVPYPRANDPKEFKKTVQGIMSTHWRRTLAAYAAALVPVVGAGVWYLRRVR